MSHRQEQFLNILTRDEAWDRFAGRLQLEVLNSEAVTLIQALGRVLAVNVIAPLDVPGFDRSNVDGFAVRSSDTSGSQEEAPQLLRINVQELSPGVLPLSDVAAGTATSIATGGMLPRGADAVVMVEYTEVATNAAGDEEMLLVQRPVAAGEAVSYAGSDISRGEGILWRGQLISSREIGVLAALGFTSIEVVRRPRVAIISTGNEVIAPGQPLPTGCVYDSNAAIIAAAVIEAGGEPVALGAFRDEEAGLTAALEQGLQCDMVVMSGGTSKGAGDLSYRVVSRLPEPGIVAHGVALKPGKPICLAVTGTKPVVILPGFPTSAIFTFHEFVAPVIRAWAGRGREHRETIEATLPQRVNSERGRTEYLLVSLVTGDHGLVAFPLGKGSGSVTTFSHADGFVTIPQHTEMLDSGSRVSVTLLDRHIAPADLVVIGSHCLGLDYLLGEMRAKGWSVKSLSVGSQGGLNAVSRGECDIAGVHLFDPATREYNRPFLTPHLELIAGYQRQQCVVFRPCDPRFASQNLEESMATALADPACLMINRNPGSGTRVLIDELLMKGLEPREEGRGAESGIASASSTPALPRGPLPSSLAPPGYRVQVKSHNAVAAAVASGRADWGVAIAPVAHLYGLQTLPLQAEHYDFLCPQTRLTRPAVHAFQELLQSPLVRQHLCEMGFQ